MVRDARQLNATISRATFVANGYSFTQPSIHFMELLHYRSLPVSELQDSAGVSSATLLHQRHAELVLRPSLSNSGLPSNQDLDQFVVDGGTQSRRLNRIVMADSIQLSTIQESATD